LLNRQISKRNTRTRKDKIQNKRYNQTQQEKKRENDRCKLNTAQEVRRYFHYVVIGEWLVVNLLK